MLTMNRTKKILIGVAVALLASLLLALFALYQFSAPQSKAPEERIIINLGTSEKELINQLHAQGYIRSPLAFSMVLTIKGGHGKIEPGGYLISKAMSAWQLADSLVNHPYQRWVLLPKETEYLYFLHDQEGKIHPARTYEEHLENIEKYLR
ncbi:UPF0755 protein [Candidatus Hakubella thermalkaliphila]|uniref:UPF0755 protein n=1 Tax=Candidatus Hakubella thermalkaliphila TaxID=2754717 RepID=A0A6V8NU52_9ACTN|nr:endolytic transglycosylase MltG [Candidatus Hakubella thermalkaliphila]GFP23818.1 UPF0755 protein [Candidatus Hakubella thermalkaliphila]GFP29985.1 UPF0755 protein [Candidatus Hakubella thermalkaliphila]GFP43319.1 UPF0755 protein [Candidatus Hakubella thermalkaliphila]